MNNINVKIKLTRGASVPAYATDGSAAVDLRAALEGGSVTIEPGCRVGIPTGIAIAPETRGVVAIVAARSGLGFKHGIALANGIGVIDSDYRGEVCAVLQNFSREPFTVSDGERIAQLVIAPVDQPVIEEVGELDGTERGAGGFGSTGQ